MKSPEQLNRELRKRILSLPGVTERENAGIHEDAFFVGRTMFMHIHGRGHCDIRLSKADQERVLAEHKASPHRWAPEAGYVTCAVSEERDLEPAMELIRKSHQHFAVQTNLKKFLPLVAALVLVGCSSASHQHQVLKQTNKHSDIRKDYRMQTVLIDKFIVPEESRTEFLESSRKVQAFIRTLPGFVEGFLFENTDGQSRYNYITTAVWENESAFENARKAVASEFQRQGYNPQETRVRLKIESERAVYKRSPY